MSFKKRVLVFPAGAEVGLEIYKAVNFSSHFELIGGTSVSDHSEYVFKDLVLLPHIDSNRFIDELNKVIKEKNIDVIYPAMDKVNYVLAKHIELIDCEVIVPSFDTVSICYSKSATYEYFRDILPVPGVYSPSEISEYPVFVKPDKGYGSRGATVVKGEDDLNKILKEIEEPVFQEYLPGEECTVDCFSKHSGEILYCQARRRTRTRIGISVRTEFYTEVQAQVLNFAEKINQKLDIQGAWFFQIKRDQEGNFKLMEIGLRIAGSSGINRIIGVNLPLLSLFNRFKIDVSINPLKLTPVIDRAFNLRAKFNLKYNTIYIDYDDCIIINDVVNMFAISLMLEAIGKGKKVVLVTKHDGDINKDLQKYRIGQLFDEIIHLDKTDLKSKYIGTDGIFVDDSYSERLEVYNTLGIPVFAPDTIPLLIENL